MSKKNDRKLALKRETLRQLTDAQLRAAAGGVASGYICMGADASGKCGSTTSMIDTRVIEEPSR